MSMKRVVAFFDMFDEIPDDAKYLFSRRLENPLDNKAQVSTDESQPQVAKSESAILFVHYYEVHSMDFEAIMTSDFIKKPNIDKMNDLFKHYKIPVGK